MAVPKLEHLSQVQVAVCLWTSKEVSGLFQVLQENWWNGEQDAIFQENQKTFLGRVIQSVNKLPISEMQKKDLMDSVERTGEEFINYTFTLPVFGDTLVPSEDIVWTMYGTINEIETLKRCLAKESIKDSSVLKRVFEYACVCCAEDLIEILWQKLPTDEQDDLMRGLSSNSCSSICLFWILELSDKNLEHKLLLINKIGNREAFDDDLGLELNMFWTAINDCSKNAVSYFFNKLTNEEKCLDREFINDNPADNFVVYFARNLNNHNWTWNCLQYAYSFFLSPCPSDKTKLILENITLDFYLELIDFVLLRVEGFPSFYELHCRILEQLIFSFPTSYDQGLTNNLVRLRGIIPVLMHFSGQPLRKISILLNDKDSKLVALNALSSDYLCLKRLITRYLRVHSVAELTDIFKVIASNDSQLQVLLSPVFSSTFCDEDSELYPKAEEIRKCFKAEDSELRQDTQ